MLNTSNAEKLKIANVENKIREVKQKIFTMDPLMQEIETLKARIDQLESDKKALLEQLPQQFTEFSDEFQIQILVTKNDLQHRISNLEEEIKMLKSDKEKLESEMIERDHKIACLDIENRERDKKIKDLESQDKLKDQKMKFLEFRVDHLSSDKGGPIAVLKMEIKQKDKKIQDIWNHFDKKMDNLMTTIENLKKENESSNTKLKHELEKCQGDLEDYKARTEDLEKSRDLISIAQLFRTLTEAMYWEVLPEVFAEDGKIKKVYSDKIFLDEMENNIEKIHETKDKQDKIKEIWKEKKDELGPEMFRYMNEMRKKRNLKAHPSLIRPKLQEIATKMPFPDRSYIEHAIKLLDQKTSALSIPWYISI